MFSGYYTEQKGKTGDHLLDEEMGSRQNLFGLPNINSVINPTEQWMNLLPVIPNPDSFFLSRIGATCTDDYGRSGICVLPSICALYGGVATGYCGIASICCISKLPHLLIDSKITLPMAPMYERYDFEMRRSDDVKQHVLGISDFHQLRHFLQFNSYVRE